jgi:DNA-binding CsgD family transcriptional regulator
MGSYRLHSRNMGSPSVGSDSSMIAVTQIADMQSVAFQDENGTAISFPPAQFETAKLMAQGKSYTEIAVMRKCSKSAVRSTAYEMFKKLKVSEAGVFIAKLYALGVFDAGKAQAPVIQLSDKQIVDTEYDEGPCTPGQKAYLAAFDRHLRSHRHNRQYELQTRLEMDYMLGAVFMEAGLPINHKTKGFPTDYKESLSD